MPKTQIEKYQSRYARIKKNPQIDNEETTREQSFLQQFNQYLKSLPKDIKISNKELLRDLFKEHGENALTEYLKQQETQHTKPPHRMIITDITTPISDNKKTENKPEENKTILEKQEKDNNIIPQTTNWLDGYEKSFTKWVNNNTYKRNRKPTKAPKRTIKTTKNENTLDIDITPTNTSPTRPDQGVNYHIEKGKNPNDVTVTVINKNPKKSLNYDYVYALVKSAKENGIDEIEFKDIKSPDFANMLVVASLQFNITMINAPKYQIDENASYIPAQLKEKICKYNDDKQPRPLTDVTKNKPHQYQRPQKVME